MKPREESLLISLFILERAPVDQQFPKDIWDLAAALGIPAISVLDYLKHWKRAGLVMWEAKVEAVRLTPEGIQAVFVIAKKNKDRPSPAPYCTVEKS